MYTLDIQPITIGKKKPESRRLPPNSNNKMHWAKRAKWVKEFKDQSYWLCKIQKLPKMKKAKIIVENYTIAPQDRDNLYSAAKPIIDGIVTAGVIPDDSEKYLDQQIRNIKVNHKSEQKLLIKIYD